MDTPFLRERFGMFKAAADRKSRERYEWFIKKYSLTPVQARIAVFIGEGGSVSGYAEETSTSPATVRTHLKAVFKKTGATRQAELATLLMRRTAAL